LITANVDQNNKAKYRLNSTVFLMMNSSNDLQGKIDVAGHVTKIKEDYIPVDPKMEL
jgi:hypothetical protein